MLRELRAKGVEIHSVGDQDAATGLGAEARVLVHGGIKLVARAAGATPTTVSRGVAELEAGGDPSPRVREAGAGRKRQTVTAPGLTAALLALVEPDERGDPMSPLRWTTKSTRALAQELTTSGHLVSAWMIANLLHEEGFNLQGNAKQVEGTVHGDRDAQFTYLNEQSATHMKAGRPVISVDTKKKEIIGLYKNGGQAMASGRRSGPGERARFPRPRAGQS